MKKKRRRILFSIFSGVYMLSATIFSVLASCSHADDPVTFIGAGDIVSQGQGKGEFTAELIEQAIAEDPDTIVFAAGDNAQDDGTLADYALNFNPTWGRFRDRVYPIAGNHDWHVSNAQGFLDYFCPDSSDCSFPDGAQTHYYSYDVGLNWHLIAIDDEIYLNGTTAEKAAQNDWIQQDLENNTRSCVLAYLHQPRFTSSIDRSEKTGLAPLWGLLQQYGADIYLNGHDHHYERFARMDKDGNRDANGLIEFTVGTGGAGLYDFQAVPHANSMVRVKDWGVLKLTLRDTDFNWQFIDIDKVVRDSGTAECGPGGGDTILLMPENGSRLSSPPSFQWAAGPYDYFRFYSYFYYNGGGYRLYVVPGNPPQIGSFTTFAMPGAWWNMLATGRTQFWTVLGINSITKQWRVAGPWTFTRD